MCNDRKLAPFHIITQHDVRVPGSFPLLWHIISIMKSLSRATLTGINVAPRGTADKLGRKRG